jgi:hypothetical protein
VRKLFANVLAHLLLASVDSKRNAHLTFTLEAVIAFSSGFYYYDEFSNWDSPSP